MTWKIQKASTNGKKFPVEIPIPDKQRQKFNCLINYKSRVWFIKFRNSSLCQRFYGL